MDRIAYRYELDGGTMETIEETLLLSIFAVESLHGDSRVRLDVAYHLDKEHRVCVMDASTDVGRDLNLLFVGFMTREFGTDSFTVDRASKEAAKVIQSF